LECTQVHQPPVAGKAVFRSAQRSNLGPWRWLDVFRNYGLIYPWLVGFVKKILCPTLALIPLAGHFRKFPWFHLRDVGGGGVASGCFFRDMRQQIFVMHFYSILSSDHTH